MPIIMTGKQFQEQSSNDPTTVLNQDLVAYYPLDGNVNDLSGNGNDGTTNATFVSDATKGRQVLETNSSNGAFVSDNSSLDGSLSNKDTVTLALWVYPYSWDGDWEMVIDKHGGHLNHSLVIAANAFGGSHMTGSIKTQNSQSVNLTIRTNVSNYLNEWHHVAITYDGVNQISYWDGTVTDSVSVNGNVNTNNATFGMGERPNDGRGFDGKMSEVRVYDQTLTQSEIQTLVNQT